MQEGLPFLQLSLLVFQLLQLLVLAELAPDGGKVEITVGEAQPAALAQQSAIEAQDGLAGPRCHGGHMQGTAH